MAGKKAATQEEPSEQMGLVLHGKTQDIKDIGSKLKEEVGEKEIQDLTDDQLSKLPPSPPRLKVENRPNGKHQYYVETASDSIDLGDTIRGVVVDYSNVRSWFRKDESGKSIDDIPHCAAVEGKPTVEEPQASDCASCPMSAFGTQCKPGVRILLMHDADGKMLASIFYLSPTAIKGFAGKKGYLRQLSNENIPVHMVESELTLESREKTGMNPWGVPEWAAVRGLSEDERALVEKEREVYRMWLSSGGEAKLATEDGGKDAYSDGKRDGEDGEPEANEEGGDEAPF